MNPNLFNEVSELTQTSREKPSQTKWTRALSERGQTVVPKSIRNYLDIEGGDSLEWQVNHVGEVVVQPKKRKSVMDLEGVVHSDNPVPDMDKVIQESKKERIKQKIEEGRL